MKSNPNYAVAHLRFGYLLFGQARLQDASAHMQQAVELDPVSPVCNAAHGFLLFMSRDYDQAIDADKKALELQPDFAEARTNLALALAIKGMYEESLAEIEKLREGNPLTAALTEIYALGFSGQTPVARQKLAQLQSSANAEQITPFDYAVLYAAIGDKDTAFEWLEKVDIKGFGRLKFAPQLDLLRADVRFAQFLTRFQAQKDS